MIQSTDFTEQQIQLTMKAVQRLMNEHTETIWGLENKFTDHVELHKSSTYVTRMKQRDELGSVMSRLALMLQDVRDAEKVLQG